MTELADEWRGAIRARVEGVRAESWRVSHEDGELSAVWGSNGLDVGLQFYPADAEFAAHARQDVPALLADRDRLAAELAELRAPVDLGYDADTIERAASELDASGQGGDRLGDVVRNLAELVASAAHAIHARDARLERARQWSRDQGSVILGLRMAHAQRLAERDEAWAWLPYEMRCTLTAKWAEQSDAAVPAAPALTPASACTGCGLPLASHAYSECTNALAAPVPAPADVPNLGTLRRLDRDPGPADDECDNGPHAYHRGPCPAAPAAVAVETEQGDDEWPELDENYVPPCGDDECRQMHCGRCNEHSGMTGHYSSVCRRLGGLNGPTVPYHMCCPGNCENAKPVAAPVVVEPAHVPQDGAL